MPFPDTLLPNQWTDGEFLNATKQNQRIDQPLNALATRVQALGGQQLMAIQTTPNTAYINAGNFVVATGMTATIDPAGAFASNVWTVPATGFYDVAGVAALQPGGTSRARTGIGVSINGSNVPVTGSAVIGASVAGGTASCAVLPTVGLSLTAGQTVGLLIFHDATTSIGTVITGGFSSFLRITRIS